ncbi:Hexosyltransferase [Heracleum sosnowskyi]|uniref:Hexosyltransferase n=1 Tax=Heracleum sosnowskyi TaxID=360622 RepID=A0AAD8HKB0_9APIA|nr:Hexosyltransferase [Heracleum sosnowskyi]
MLPKCDIIVINTPLTEKTKGLFDKAKISKLKKGVLIVNNARGAIMDTQAVVDGCSSGHIAGKSLDKTISNLEMELAAARVVQDSILTGIPISGDLSVTEPTKRRKYLMVIGINTAFSSRKRIDYVRATWMQQGEKLKKLEDEKGIIMRFVIGHSATSGGILDRAIEAEEQKHGDFLRPDHVEGYLELSTKTKIYFATAVALWDADFYVKVDDDVHVNIVFEEVQQWIWRIASCTA